MIILAAAMGVNNELGKDDGKPLWDLPDEYANFRKQIKFHPVVMGRKSFDVIQKPLPDSLNIVITRKKEYNGNGAIVVNTLEEAIKAAQPAGTIYVIGGGEIFNIAINLADKMELSRIDGTFPDADAFFPEFSENDWQLTSSVKHEKDEHHAYSFVYQTWIKK